MTPWQRMRALMRPERKDLKVVLVYGVAVSLLSLVVPVTAQALVNVASFGTVLQPVLVLAAVAFTFLAVAGILQALQVKVAELIQQRLFARLSIELSHRLPRIRVDAYDRQRGTELVNRFLEVATVQKGASLILLDGFTLSLQTVTGLVLLAFYSPVLLGFDLVLLVCIGIVLFGLGRGAVRTSVAESHAKYEVMAWLEELARVPLAFKGAHGPTLALRRADQVTQHYLHQRRAHFRVLFRQTIGTLGVQAFASAFLLGLGGWLV
ncbi:MAG TPA: ABC transporter transmembrane domain-containing protein, partial [Myxococcaceae bacterium]|nr:ABC transporter transmembrane domain-containing protein [Myxococcaceae bacterium]